jgi:hypothetical protein
MGIYWTFVRGLALPAAGMTMRIETTGPVDGLIFFELGLGLVIGEVVLIVNGLVRWHRLVTLGEADGGSKGECAGRAQPLFIDWFVVGLGFVIAMLISQGVAMGGLALLSGESPPVWIARAITMPAGTLQFYALFLVFALIACILFALIFKRRSLMLPYVVTDARSEAALDLGRKPPPRPRVTTVPAAVLFCQSSQRW